MTGEWRVASGSEVLKNQVSRKDAETRGLFEHFMVKICWGIALQRIVAAVYERRDFRYTPDSANSAWEVVFKFDELFQFLAAHTNAS